MSNTSSTFSDQLSKWLKSSRAKTLLELNEVFGEKTFAVVFVLLMSIPALPIPTGGITHVFEVMTMLVALELIIGLKTVWLPKRWKNRALGKFITDKTLPFMLKRIRWVEKYSRPRLSGWLQNRYVRTVVGLLVFGLTLTAFLAPPFSGLDTLPAMGVVLIGLGIILEDFASAVAGLLVGSVGVALVIGLGKLIVTLISNL